MYWGTHGGSAISRTDEFSQFWGRQRDALYRALAVTLGDSRLADEAVDEAMARAWEHWPKVRDYEQPAAWVYRVAFNWATSWRRKMTRRPTRPTGALDRGIEDRVADVDLEDGLAALRPADRRLIVLRYYLEFTPSEIAHALGVPAGTVRSQLSRAMAALRVEMEATS